MASPEPNDLPVVDPSATPCRHLRNKGMYVYTDGSAGETDPDYDNAIYWCFQTMKSFGPDDDYVSRDECRNASRTCYEPM